MPYDEYRQFTPNPEGGTRSNATLFDNRQQKNSDNPCERLSRETLEIIGGIGNHKMIWCGDFNAHSTLWGSIHTDQNGNVLEEMLEWKDLICLNDGRNTRVDVAQGRTSAIDLTLASQSLARKCVWSVMEESTVGSVHFPISCKIGIELQQVESEENPRWKLKSADWKKFQEISETRMLAIDISIEDVDELNKCIRK